VQLYATAPKGNIAKPVQELKAFTKTRLLNPGEAQTLKFTVKAEDLASFNEAESAWVTESGKYVFNSAASSADARQKLEVELK
jgi:beta-glucosidase